MLYPLKAHETGLAVQYPDAAEALNMTAAATLMACRRALVKSPAACLAALAKHRASMNPELATVLEIAGSYTIQSSRMGAPRFMWPRRMGMLQRWNHLSWLALD